MEALEAWLGGVGEVAVAVSGGVDSVTLSMLAHRTLGARATMFHALSPAVPLEGTVRVRTLAAEQRWDLRIIDAAELADPNYRRNPVDRCFYCKSNLYATIMRQTNATVVSGTNLDDLGDFRPGLRAAAEGAVRHPFVEAEVSKVNVRKIARALGMAKLSELPASPCLASRVETGILMDAHMLRAIDRAEQVVGRLLAPEVVRCRVRHEVLAVELDDRAFRALTSTRREELVIKVSDVFRQGGVDKPVIFDVYKMGSAFLR
ncbi:MAG: adenine nucleotide alpha hydrolase [Deltaproteobacteria bacterium]|nr:adenine nucleotide alpha hydrolase [Deltaproteobacteria bacterium]